MTVFAALGVCLALAFLIGVLGPAVLQALEKHHIVTNPRKRATWAISAAFVLFVILMLILGIPAYQMESLGAIVYAAPLLLMGAIGYAIVIYVGFWIADRMWTAKAARQSHRPQHTH